MDIFSRVVGLIGEDNFFKLQNSSVAVFGVGGVGGFVVEGLVRSGIGKIAVIDNDTISDSNINRQIIATCDSLGKNKVDVIEQRALSINKNVKIEKYNTFFLPNNSSLFDFSKFDYIVDAVDTVSAKIEIISKAKENGVNVISSMGTAGKLNPLQLKVCDIKDTKICPLARVMRKELKERNIDDVKVVYSEEEVGSSTINQSNGKRTPSSMIFVPATAGLIIAEEIVKDIIK